MHRKCQTEIYSRTILFHSRGNPATFVSSPRELRNISFHPCGIPVGYAGFPQSPSPCRSLHLTSMSTYRMHHNHSMRTNLFTHLQLFLNLHVIVSPRFLLGQMSLETDNRRLSKVRQQSATSWITRRYSIYSHALRQQMHNRNLKFSYKIFKTTTGLSLFISSSSVFGCVRYFHIWTAVLLL